MNVKKIISTGLTVLVVGMVVMSGVMKLAGNPEGNHMLEAVGVGSFRLGLGLAEIIFAALFAFPKTMKLGFILLSCYFAGALATELSHQVNPNALVLLVLIWATAFLRDRSVFI
ncbi:hypothetical protein BWI93_23895 [Siphonobacter sp. BAB-5385]|uniref:DoxX family protein n=1 Tax=unclassified Siphonobacter TaxID=2635712 RepID=UPI000B9EACF3|nr:MULTISPECIES: DoxX family protein [unclassified Siphonobacter]OZI05733.1 hypothetical protein BWI93_23895 [Siphonobacter sp. BAB-5385]PMD87113.1 hypothetical protein BWI97_25990 [Siphonobacter sp. BAB-5405]